MTAHWRSLGTYAEALNIPDGEVMFGARFSTVHPYGDKWLVMLRPKTWYHDEVTSVFVDTEKEAKDAAEAFEIMVGH